MIITTPDKLWYTGKQWIKRLDSVDTSKSDGYAFAGSFERFAETTEITADTWYLVFGQDASRSGNVTGQRVVLYRASAQDGTVERAGQWDVGRAGGWALRCRDEIAAILAGPAAVPDAAALRAEREQLLARVAEIDGLLAGGDTSPGYH